MAHLGATFDATTVDPATGFELFPPARYVVQIVGSEMRPTKDGGGQYLWLELDVLEGPLAGRKLFDRLNLVNASAQTVEIAADSWGGLEVPLGEESEAYEVEILEGATVGSGCGSMWRWGSSPLGLPPGSRRARPAA